MTMRSFPGGAHFAELARRRVEAFERGNAMDVTLLRTLGRAWWLVLLRGIVAIVFGLLAWAWPGATLITLALFWGAYALVDGIAALWGGWQAKDGGKPMWQIVLIGVLGIAAGIITFVAPG